MDFKDGYLMSDDLKNGKSDLNKDLNKDDLNNQNNQNQNQKVKDKLDKERREDETLKIMKMRIITSYRWYEDVVLPLSAEFGISPENFEDILIKRLDMTSLDALQPRFESAKPRCIKERIHADLRLCWISDVMNILTEEETENITNKIANEVLKENKSYDEAIKDGRKDLLEFLMR